MTIILKNKDTLIVNNFRLKCCIGRGGLNKNKFEGDGTTPKGKFNLGKLYWRSDRVKKPITSLLCKKIEKNSAWCTDSKSKYYNKEIIISKKISHEKLYRKDYKYDYLVVIKYNMKKTIPNKGSANFLHLTKNYYPTAGCVALKKKDFLILLKLIDSKTKIKIH